jgi:hypothetical protein
VICDLHGDTWTYTTPEPLVAAVPKGGPSDKTARPPSMRGGVVKVLDIEFEVEK